MPSLTDPLNVSITSENRFDLGSFDVMRNLSPLPPIPPVGSAARALAVVRSKTRGNGRLPPRIAVQTSEPSVRWTARVDEPLQRTEATYQVAEVQNYEVIVSDLVIQQTPLTMDDLIIEHAYDVYAHGHGNVLGPCIVTRNDATHDTTLTYQFVQENAENGLTAARLQEAMRAATTSIQRTVDGMVYLQRATTAASTALHNFTDTAGEWIPLTAAGSSITLTYTGVISDEPRWTPEQMAARKAAAAERQVKMEVVRQTAERLLLAYLNDVQRQTWKNHGYIDVLSQFGRRYRLKNFNAHNVTLLNADGRETRKYCAFANDPGGTLPLGDHIVTQMMTLQFNELEFLRKANTWDLVQPKHPFIGQGADAVAVPQAAA